MDIVIDIQGFCDVEENFIPKEVAINTERSPDTELWHHPVHLKIYPWEQNEKTGLHEIIMESNGSMETSIQKTLRYICVTLHDTHATSIPEDKRKLVIWVIYFLETYMYNLEGISSAFKNLSDFEGRGQRCTHHGFRTSVESRCALRNAYKLKRWLTMRHSNNSSYDNLSSENWSESVVESEKTDSENSPIQFKNQKHRYHSQH